MTRMEYICDRRFLVFLDYGGKYQVLLKDYRCRNDVQEIVGKIEDKLKREVIGIKGFGQVNFILLNFFGIV